MNKKNNRKGFTTVELVIVIAVIAILATVLIPTFSNLVNNANDSAALQNAKTTYDAYLTAYDYTKGTVPSRNALVVVKEAAGSEAGQYLIVKDGAITKTVYKTAAAALEVIAANANLGTSDKEKEVDYTGTNGVTVYEVYIPAPTSNP